MRWDTLTLSGREQFRGTQNFEMQLTEADHDDPRLIAIVQWMEERSRADTVAQGTSIEVGG